MFLCHVEDHFRTFYRQQTAGDIMVMMLHLASKTSSGFYAALSTNR